MQTTHHIEVIRRHTIRYACGCTTTRIQVERASPASLPTCTGHDAVAISEETTTEYPQTADSESGSQK